jgi:hypothetical protein
LIKRLSTGRRFQKCHLEYIYQYLKIKSESLCKKGRSSHALIRLESSIKIIQGLFEQRFDIGPQNYFYFSGFLSGIQVNAKAIPNSEFIKVNKLLLLIESGVCCGHVVSGSRISTSR